MNGARSASADFGEFLAAVFIQRLKLVRGTMEPCLFKAEGLLRVCVHVDDPNCLRGTKRASQFLDRVGDRYVAQTVRCVQLRDSSFLSRA